VDSEVLSHTTLLARALSTDEGMYVLTHDCSEGCTYQLLITDDGQEWRPVADPITDADLVEDIAYASGRYIAAGEAQDAAIWSSLGSLWSRNTQANIFEPAGDGGPGGRDNDATSTIHAVVRGKAGWLAGGQVRCADDVCVAEQSGEIGRFAAWTSADGRKWSRIPWHQGPAAIWRMATNGDSLVATSDDAIWL
jgi:hypothetical protein